MLESIGYWCKFNAAEPFVGFCSIGEKILKIVMVLAKAMSLP